MSEAALAEIEKRLLAHLQARPAILADLAADLRLPVAAVEALAHSLKRRGLAEVRPAGNPPIQTWFVRA